MAEEPIRQIVGVELVRLSWFQWPPVEVGGTKTIMACLQGDISWKVLEHQRMLELVQTSQPGYQLKINLV